MKLIHTSDWHLGHTLYSYNREDEFRDFICQLAHIVRNEHPDAILISGDIFDSALPTLSARRLWTDALLELKVACPEMTVVATAGNHDSGSSLDVSAPLLKEDFHIVGKRHDFIRIEDSDGQGALICAVPFITENGFRSRLPESLATADNPRKEFYEWILSEAKNKTKPGDAIVLMAHEAVSNSVFLGQEKYNFNFAGLDNFGKDYNYLALGHIHCPQIVWESDIRIAAYSGSPLPMSFDEDYPHSVSIIEFNRHGDKPSIRGEVITPLRKLMTMPVDSAISESEALDYVRTLLDGGVKGYLRLNVASSRPLPSLHARLRNMLGGTDLRFCLIKYNFENGTISQAQKNVPQLSIQDLRTVDPLTLALDYYRRKTGVEMDEEMRRCLLDIISDRE